MTVLIFPGQGSQFSYMSKDFHDNFSVAKDTFQEIEDYTSINLRKIIFSDNDKLLNRTDITQLSIFSSSLAIYNTLIKEKDIALSEIDIVLGHSLGEYTALVCSQKINLKDASIILKKRGELMHNSLKENFYGMVALIGSSVQDIENIIKKNDINLEIANDNSPIQIVLSGKLSDIDNNAHIFKENKIKKYIKLNVSSAFHSSYMKDAQNELGILIDNLDLNQNHIKIISNYTAKLSNEVSEIKQSLKKQMASRVRWTESILNLENYGHKNIIEIGPGKVLSGLIKRTSNFFNIKSVNKIEDLSTI